MSGNEIGSDAWFRRVLFLDEYVDPVEKDTNERITEGEKIGQTRERGVKSLLDPSQLQQGLPAREPAEKEVREGSE
jgi:hypothetical protein